MIGLISLVGGWAAKFIGGHLVSNFLGRAESGIPNTLESLAFGLGGRFFMGLGAGFYLQNSAFRHGANQAAMAVKDAVLGIFGSIL